jgi:drug/metabolite transporter (DMT)-like permease
MIRPGNMTYFFTLTRTTRANNYSPPENTHLNNKPVPIILIWTALVLLMASWGGSFIAMKIGVKYLTPYELVLARFVPSAFLLWIIAVLKRKDIKHKSGFWRTLSQRQKWGLVLAAFLAVPGYHFCLNTGLTIIPAGWASLVISLNPACITVFAALILSEKIGIRRWIGISISFLALAYIALSRDIQTGNGEVMSFWAKTIGMLITFGAVLCWGGFTVLGKKFIRDHDSLVVLAWIIGLGTLMVLPGLRSDFFEKMANGNSELWVSVIFLSVICTVAGFAVWYWVLETWDASRAGAFIYLVPVFALISGLWILGEPLDLSLMLSASVVVGGVILAGGKGKKV